MELLEIWFCGSQNMGKGVLENGFMYMCLCVCVFGLIVYFVCVCVCVCVCARVCVRAHTGTHICMCTGTHMCICRYILALVIHSFNSFFPC